MLTADKPTPGAAWHVFQTRRWLMNAMAALVAPICLAQTSPPPEDMGVHFSTTVEEPLFGSTTVTTGGLRGEIYFLEPETLALPKFDQLKPVGAVYTNALNIPPREFTDGFPGVTNRFEWFAIDYTGTFYIKKPGKYRFVLVSDDGSKLYIDGRVVINNDGHHPALRRDGMQKLSAGPHTIRLSYFQGPRFQIALTLRIRTPADSAWRLFDMREFRPPANANAAQ